MIYLAGPYTHDDPKVRAERAKELTRVCVQLIQRGEQVFSPITLGHTLWELDNSLPTDAFFWETYNYWFLAKCTKMLVLKLPDWEYSTGVSREIDFCNRHDIPIEYVDLEDTYA